MSVNNKAIESLLADLNQILIGKNQTTLFALTCIIAQGHLLIEDIPGVGKTTLARALAKLLGLDFSRIQFTNDLLPADILGGNIYNSSLGKFEFVRGPIFTQFLLADELNRASPKTQSAVLEAMEERKITIEGKNYPLKQPFFFVATQNPTDQSGTNPLPESQLDRFMIRVSIGFPDRKSEKEILMGQSKSEMIDNLTPKLNELEILNLQKQAMQNHVSDQIIEYVQSIVDATRTSSETGISTRGAIALISSAKSYALLQGRDMVIPEDIQELAIPVLAHRLISDSLDKQNDEIIKQIIATVKIP